MLVSEREHEKHAVGDKAQHGSAVTYRGREIPSDLPKITLTENQKKVIADKYIKDAPTPEAWLWNIAENLALAELLYSRDVSDAELFAGVRHEKREHEGPDGKKTTLLLFHQQFAHYNDWDENYKKFIRNLYDVASKNPAAAEKVRKTAMRFYSLMSRFDFLPNSPTLMNSGRDLQQLSACYVLPVGDSIEEIYDSVKNMAMVHKSGGGTGFSFSRLRPRNAPVKTTKGVSSGPVTFMGLFDKSTDVVKQGGTRRGANMGILHYTHPDLREFIHCKDGNNAFENFNISVTIDKKFMEAAKNNEEIDQIDPRSGKAVGRVNAKDLFDEMVESAWKSGDPGIIIIDRINETESNPTPHVGMI